MKTEKGFTFIELLVVIVLLAILATTTLPKFVDLSTQAKVAANRGLAGSFADTVVLAHGSWLAQGQPASAITVGSSSVFVGTTNGYPCDSGRGSTCTTAASTNACMNLWNAIQSANDVPAVSGTPCPTGVPVCYITSHTGALCTYTRSDITDVSILYNSGSGDVTPSP